MPNPSFNRDKLPEIEKFLAEAGFEKRELTNKLGIEFLSQQGGKIQFYSTGRTNIQGNAEQKERLSTFWDENCKGFEIQNSVNRRENKTFVFHVPNAKIEELKQTVQRGFGHLKIEETCPPNALYRLTITDADNNKITVTQYTRQRKWSKLLLQGLESETWFFATNIIGNSLNIVFQTNVANILYHFEDVTEPIDVIAVVNAEHQQAASKEIQGLLGKCYDFLYEHDKELIESSQYLLTSGLNPKDYFGFVSGTIRALEGYVKTLLVGIEACEFTDYTPDWKFGSICNLTDRTIARKLRLRLSADSTKAARQQHVFLSLVDIISQHRNPSFHNSPPVIRNFPTIESASSLHNQIVDTMRASYNLFETEITRP